ncbi:MAG: prepilin-type N-terminal cleavage/methylation domain-containing protein, partial [Oscillospiraceae bacterium]
MIQKIKSKKGFTLAELLIVIAIIGVLIAIAIPVFGSQLAKANVAVDQANERSAKASAVVAYMSNSETET